jgi:hypothetical protein
LALNQVLAQMQMTQSTDIENYGPLFQQRKPTTTAELSSS